MYQLHMIYLTQIKHSLKEEKDKTWFLCIFLAHSENSYKRHDDLV